jgi:hypothetical protein
MDRIRAAPRRRMALRLSALRVLLVGFLVRLLALAAVALA